MNRSPDDRQIQQLMRRLKQADQPHAPPFPKVMRAAKQPGRRSPRPQLLLLVAVGLLAAVLASGAWLVRRSTEQQLVVSPTEPAFQVGIDFDQLRQAVDDHFGPVETSPGNDLLVWSGRTDSLLTLNLDEPGSKP